MSCLWPAASFLLCHFSCFHGFRSHPHVTLLSESPGRRLTRNTPLSTWTWWCCSFRVTFFSRISFSSCSPRRNQWIAHSDQNPAVIIGQLPRSLPMIALHLFWLLAISQVRSLPVPWSFLPAMPFLKMCFYFSVTVDIHYYVSVPYVAQWLGICVTYEVDLPAPPPPPRI